MHWFRFAPMPLALASFLGWAQPAAAINLDNYIPFNQTAGCIANGSLLCVGKFNFVNPTVIEYVSFECESPFGAALNAISVNYSGLEATPATDYLDIPAIPRFLGNVLYWTGGQTVRLYNLGLTLTVQANFSTASSTLLCNFHVVGESAPPG
jgi:hypothetical protein